ncbi:glycoside hydrolase family 76 protein [Nocardia sp. NBC_01327]|uniref:glycoside hydrolase family 76 protein n=1 Tax=Nocardia sp. NBC_01327 TaxID=2903593 RepID=UPI002E11635D|nr:glycoside hydrolase family 76 protein [Nocardia sp. NBC_01327]
MIGRNGVRWGAALGVAGLAVATYLVVRQESAPDVRMQPLPNTPGDIQAVNPQVRVWTRTITLIRADGAAAASIENGQPGDSAWLDRSDKKFRPRDEIFGAASIPASTATQRGPFYRYAGGLLRACGKAADRPEIRCTRWTAPADPPPDQRMRAVERLLDRYDHGTGLWEHDASTWQSAKALTTVIDYMGRTGDRQYLGYLDETFRHGDIARTGVPVQTGYNDDELWWALAWIRAFDLTQEPRYLDAARKIVDRLGDQRASFCDGGLAWARTGIDPDLHPWTQVWDWFTTGAGRALLDPSGVVNDHLDQYGSTCVLVDENRRWTYDQGMLISGLVALYRASGNSALLTSADRIAGAATHDGSVFIQNGILNEPSATTCPGPECHDAETYKGVLVRGYRELVDTGRSEVATREFLTRQTYSLRDTADEYGFRWQGLPRDDDHPNFATQTAALDALNAI